MESRQMHVKILVSRLLLMLIEDIWTKLANQKVRSYMSQNSADSLIPLDLQSSSCLPTYRAFLTQITKTSDMRNKRILIIIIFNVPIQRIRACIQPHLDLPAILRKALNKFSSMNFNQFNVISHICMFTINMHIDNIAQFSSKRTQ